MERPYDISISCKRPKDGKILNFKMREAIAEIDMNLQMKCLDPRGQLNNKELLFQRIIDTVEGMDYAKVKTLDQFTYAFLINKWMEYNEPNAGSFLGTEPTQELQNGTTKQSQS